MTDQRIEERILQEAEGLEREWDTSPRWRGVERSYSAEDVVRLRGSFRVEHSIARRGAERLWELVHDQEYVAALGALTGGQAVEMVKAGLKAIYLSGWQVAADANLASHTYPDQSLYPANSVPSVVRRINNALQRADQIAWAEGRTADTLAPIVADAEAGFGGTLNAFELMKSMIEAGAAGVHFEDQLASEKKCGHLGGKVLVPTDQFVRTLIAARLAADVLGVPSLVVARTDALGATLAHERHRPPRPPLHQRRAHARGLLLRRERHRGRDRARPGIRAVLRHDLVRDVDARTSTRRGCSPRAIHSLYPDKLLAYNCSPSFNWKQHLDDATIARFQKELGAMGYKFQFITLAGFHALEREHVRPRQGLRERGHDRLRAPAGAGVRDGGRRVHRHPPPDRGRHRVLRPGLDRDHGRQLVDPRAEGLDRRGPVQGVTPTP